MNKLEQLKAAHGASTQGAWRYKMYGVDAERKEIAVLIPHYTTAKADGQAIALAHNMMDDLLAAAELLEKALPLVDGYRRLMLGEGDITASNMRHVLARLKGEVRT